ncbi:MAG: hypothetical protein QN120_00005 [Armatimonadota bacterium]|nr:hypothetical protein [Armatimonadota bacterium]
MPEPDITALGISAAYALIAFVPLAGRHLRRPLVSLCLVAGLIAGFFTREAVRLAAEVLAPFASLSTGPASDVASVAIASVVGEVLKALAPLALILMAPTGPGRGLAYGAAAGAGFGFVMAHQGLAMALGLAGSPFITPASTVAAVAGWFFRVLPHTLTTAYVARAGAVGGAGGALLVACLVQFALGFADRLPVILSIPTGLIPTAAISLIFYVYLWRARRTLLDASGP